MEGDLARVKDALATAEEAMAVAEESRRKAKSEVARLEVDQTPLLIEPRIKISVNTDISVIGFYGNIGKYRWIF